MDRRLAIGGNISPITVSLVEKGGTEKPRWYAPKGMRYETGKIRRHLRIDNFQHGGGADRGYTRV
ncbi:MAG: hypothetical protein HKP12_15755 [Gammaproteobacteria bacterium]|nr:hypothetical protein [Gammaproteobacteria bacterium]NNJ98603.1 hypothetical protein [Gammaproteobacteria bacterium]